MVVTYHIKLLHMRADRQNSILMSLLHLVTETKSNDKNHNVKGILYFICILYMEKDVKMVFTLQPMVSFCSAFKLNSCLVRAKLLRGNW